METNRDVAPRAWGGLGATAVDWRWALGLGIVLIVLGILAIFASVLFTMAVVSAIGALLVIAAIAQAVHASRAHRWTGALLSVVTAIVYAIVGLLLVTRPLLGAMAITLLMASFFLVVGIFRCVAAFLYELPHKGWAVASGMVSIILGLLIWAQLPGASLWLIGTFVGIELILFGASWIGLALGTRHKAHAAA